MNVAEIRQTIADTLDHEEFETLIREGKYADDEIIAKMNKIFPSFKEIECGRGSDGDHDSYSWVFQIEDKFYEIVGWHSSYEGSNMDDPFDFTEVKQEEKVIKVWVPVKK